MITKLSGTLVQLDDNCAMVAIDALEYQVLIPEFTRRHLQMDLGNKIQLHTIHYLEGNAAQGGRLFPRLVGFLTEVEREFFELFCSVDGVGVKKALRAMVRPVQDVARAIDQQDIKSISTLPGIGPATAERIVAKLRRKMPKFALLVPRQESEETRIERNLVEETFQILLSLGHSEGDARQLLEGAIGAQGKFKDVESLLHAVYQQTR